MKSEINDIISKYYPEYNTLTNEEAKDDFWDNLSDKERYIINTDYLKQVGTEKYDYIVSWEPGRFNTDEVIINYETLYDADYKWWQFQKDSEWEYIEKSQISMEKGLIKPENVAKSINKFNDTYAEYKVSLTGEWYRLIENDKLLYSQFISLKWYLYYILEEYIDSLQEEQIPYNFNTSDDDNFLEIINDDDPTVRYNASGREKELEGLLKLLRDYHVNKVTDVIDNVIRKYTRIFAGKTFRFDRGYEDNENFDPFTDFIFFDEQSLKNVRTKHFLKDFAQHQLDNRELEKVINDVKEIVLEDFKVLYEKNRSRYL